MRRDVAGVQGSFALDSNPARTQWIVKTVCPWHPCTVGRVQAQLVTLCPLGQPIAMMDDSKANGLKRLLGTHEASHALEEYRREPLHWLC